MIRNEWFRGACAVLIGAGMLTLASCGDGSITDGVGLEPAPAKLDIVSGQQQSAPANAELPEPLVIRVTDAKGNPLGGQIVNFRVTSGGGSVFGGASLTNSSGIAQERWTLGSALGAQSLEARAVDATTGEKRVYATFQANAYDPDAAVATVAVAPARGSVQAGATLQFSALARDAQGNTLSGRSFTWASSNTSVATVSSRGLVTGRAAGSATITATSEGQSGSVALTVTAPSQATEPPPSPQTPVLATTSVSADSFSVRASWNRLATAASYEASSGAMQGTWTWQAAAPDTTVTFRVRRGASSNATYWFCVGGVNAAGTGQRACNQYTEPAPSGGSEPAPSVASVAVSPPSGSVAVDETIQLTATTRDAQGNALTGRTVTWASSNTSVATVSSRGVVTGRAAGSATITATSEGRSGSANVTATVTTPEPEPAPPSGEVLFRSSWNSGTGNGDAAVSDGGIWPALVCPAFARQPVLSVVPGSQIGWTATANVLQVTNRGSEYCGQVETRNQLPQGQDLFIRMYIRVENESQINFHPVDLNCCGDIQVPLWSIDRPQAGVSYVPRMIIKPRDGRGDQRFSPPALAQRQWYRFEWHVDYVSGGRSRVYPRIYDLAGTLLYDADDYRHQDTGQTLQAFYDAGGYNTFSNLDLARRFAIGYEGSAMARDNGALWYYAAVEIRSDSWVGPVR